MYSQEFHGNPCFQCTMFVTGTHTTLLHGHHAKIPFTPNTKTAPIACAYAVVSSCNVTTLSHGLQAQAHPHWRAHLLLRPAPLRRSLCQVWGSEQAQAPQAPAGHCCHQPRGSHCTHAAQPQAHVGSSQHIAARADGKRRRAAQ